MKVAVLLFLSSFAWSADQKPPAITPEHRARFWRRDSENQRAQQAASQAQTALAAAVADLQKDCGDTYQPVFDKDGEPSCEARQAPPEAKPAE